MVIWGDEEGTFHMQVSSKPSYQGDDREVPALARLAMTSILHLFTILTGTPVAMETKGSWALVIFTKLVSKNILPTLDSRETDS